MIRATLTDKGRKLLSRGKFKVAKFALGDDEIDYNLLDPDKFDGTTRDETVDPPTTTEYREAVFNTEIVEAIAEKNKAIRYGLDSYDEGILYLTDQELEEMNPNVHAAIEVLPILKSNEKLSISPTLSGSVYYMSVNDETTEKLDTIPDFKFLTTNRHENTKIIIESGIERPPAEIGGIIAIGEGPDLIPSKEAREQYIIKKFLLDHDYFIYADNKFFRKIIGINQASRFENFASGEVIINLKTGNESPAVSYESEYDSYATFITRGIPNLIATQRIGSTLELSTSGKDYSQFDGPRGSVMAFNPLIDQELQRTSTGERDIRYSKYGYQEQFVFSELPTDKFDYIDTTIYVMGGTTNSRVRVPLRLIRYVGT